MKHTAFGPFIQPYVPSSLDNSLKIRERMNLSTVTSTTEKTKQNSQALPIPRPSSWRTYTYPTPIETDGEHVTVQNPTSLTGRAYSSVVEGSRKRTKFFNDIKLPPILPRYIPYPVPNCEFRGIPGNFRPAAQDRSRGDSFSPIHLNPNKTISNYLSGPSQPIRSNYKPLEVIRYEKVDESHVMPLLSPDSACIKTTVHTNQPYLREHLHCVRYLKEDLHLPWGVVHSQFHQIFSSKPGFIERESEAALTSRSYRDNFTYASVNCKPLLNYNGVPIRVQAKVRRRRAAGEKHIPFKLIEKHPSWAIKYSWVKPEHKAIAQAILDGKDPDYYNSEKDRHRRVIELAERIEEKLTRRSSNANPKDSDNSLLSITTPPTSPIHSFEIVIQRVDELMNNK